jgi:hypothetical protein
LKKAIKRYQLSTDFSERSKIAQDRKNWRAIFILGPNSETDENAPTARDGRAARRNQK